jgi:general secretion pathway protein G
MAALTVSGNRKTVDRRDGFTLIELLVVLSIIATLLMIAVPRYFHSLDRSKEAVLREDLATMRDALDKHYSDLSRYPDTLDELVEKHYLRKIPEDPETKSSETWVTTLSEDEAAPGIRDVHSGSPNAAPDGTPFAEW